MNLGQRTYVAVAIAMVCEAVKHTRAHRTSATTFCAQIKFCIVWEC